MRDHIKKIEEEALIEIAASVGDKAAIEALRIKYLGRKGVVSELFKKMGELPGPEKPMAGQLLNELKNAITQAIDSRLSSGPDTEDGAQSIDVTLPGTPHRLGKIHPITKTIQEICDIFISLGFRVVEGPEIETEHYNFETLNIPLEHPSRDAFDTFYLKQTIDHRPQTTDQKHLLRSHTSPVQTRFMEKNKPPFSIIVPGKVYRPDATDASHSFMFHQVEALVVGDNIKFSDLKGVLSIFARQMFGKSIKMRFRPSFFPFTEPSAEVDISCILCSSDEKLSSEARRAKAERKPVLRSPKGEGGTKNEQRKCSLCGGKGWLEILGAGMVNPKVFSNVGYDAKKVTGLAFGMGVERIAILKYGISDIRMFFENDVRFLRQF